MKGLLQENQNQSIKNCAEKSNPPKRKKYNSGRFPVMFLKLSTQVTSVYTQRDNQTAI
jgi:hypothetical protein